MSEVRVRWRQRVMGRYPGDEETVEHTPMIDALLANDRLEIIAETYVPPQPEPVGVYVPPLGNDLGQVLEDVHVDLPAAVSEVEFEVPKPAVPKPRAPRKGSED